MFARIRPFLPIAVLGFFIFYFGFQALTGERGLLAWSDRAETLRVTRAKLCQVQAEKAELEQRARLLRSSSLSRDLLQERAQAILGLADPRDYVIRTATPKRKPNFTATCALG